METERVPMILFFNFMLFYLCECFKKEKDVFLKLIYLFKYHIISSTYVFSLFKRTKNKSMNNFSEIERLIYIIPLFWKIICFLYYFQNEIEYSCVQILCLICNRFYPIIVIWFKLLIFDGKVEQMVNNETFRI